MSHIGSPLIGDELYSGDCSEMKRHALHCFAVSFKSNAEGAENIVMSPVPYDMKSYLVSHFGNEAVEEVLNIGDKVKVEIIKISEKGIDLKLLEKLN